MSWYEFLLFLHVAGAGVWVGGATAIQFFALRTLRASDPIRMAAFAGDLEWIGNRVLLAASGLAVLSGILLVIDSDFWGFGDDWILLALSRADLMLLFLIVFDMATKPSFGDAWLYVAILVAGVVAAVLVRNGMNANVAAATVTE